MPKHVNIQEMDESAFKTYVLNKWHDGNFICPIQSRTVPGIPDVYTIDRKGQVYWVEFKRIHQKFYSKNSIAVKVPFRTGQQAWAVKHYKISGVPVYLYVLFDDCIAVIPLTCLHDRGYIRKDDFEVMRELSVGLGIPESKMPEK